MKEIKTVAFFFRRQILSFIMNKKKIENMSDRKALPSGFVRKIIAWLPLVDAFHAGATCQRWRACSICTIVAGMSSRDTTKRLQSCRAVRSLCTDLSSLHSSIVSDVHIALIKMLQDGEDGKDEDLYEQAESTIWCLHNRYTEIDENDGDPFSDSAESEILKELPVLAGLANAESEEEDSGDDAGEGKLGERKAGETPAGEKRPLPRARMKVPFHCPAQFVPVVDLCNIAGNAAVTVIQRFDSKRRLMTIGTWYLEGFIESEVDADVALGETIILWYARSLVGGMAVSGQLTSANGGPARALILGLGAGSIPAFLRHHYDHISVDTVDWSAAVVRAAKEVFNLSSDDDDKVNVYTAEACDFISGQIKAIKDKHGSLAAEEAEEEKYDTIMVDIYTEDGTPPPLTDPKFMRNLKKLLRRQASSADDGDEHRRESIVVFNAGNEMKGFDKLLSDLEKVFNFVHSFEHPDEENVVIMCSEGDLMGKDEGERWRKLAARDIPETSFRMYLSKCSPEFDSTFVSWMDDQSCTARDSRAVNTPLLQLPLTSKKRESGPNSPVRYGYSLKK